MLCAERVLLCWSIFDRVHQGSLSTAVSDCSSCTRTNAHICTQNALTNGARNKAVPWLFEDSSCPEAYSPVWVRQGSNSLRQEMDTAQTTKTTFYVLSVANWNNLPCFIYVEETSGMLFQSPCERTVPSSRLHQFSMPQFLSFKGDH